MGLLKGKEEWEDAIKWIAQPTIDFRVIAFICPRPASRTIFRESICSSLAFVPDKSPIIKSIGIRNAKPKILECERRAKYFRVLFINLGKAIERNIFLKYVCRIEY